MENLFLKVRLTGLGYGVSAQAPKERYLKAMDLILDTLKKDGFVDTLKAVVITLCDGLDSLHYTETAEKVFG